MKFLLLFIGLGCIIAYFWSRKDANKKLMKFFIISGVLLIFFDLIFLFLNLEIGFSMLIITITIVMSFVWYAVRLKDARPLSKNLTAKQNNILRYSLFYIFIIAFISFFYSASFPSVKLEHAAIYLGGGFGGNFKIADIQSLDTISVYPKIGIRLGGFSGFGLSVGNFSLKNEKKTAKLYFWKNIPPYISIRMKDSRLFILNFRNPDKTVEFYNQIKDELKSN
jgi:hypothetical protein